MTVLVLDVTAAGPEHADERGDREYEVQHSTHSLPPHQGFSRRVPARCDERVQWRAMEPLLVWTLIGAAVVVLLRRSRAPSTRLLAAALVVSTAAGHALWAARTARQARSVEALRKSVPQPHTDRGYVSSDPCRACHPSEYATWHRSYHRTMTQTASAATVRAPFAGETLVADDGRSYHLRRHDDELWVDISGVGARRIGMMTGSHHMQAFWIPGGQGNEQIEFPFTYLFDDQRWVARRDVFLVGREYAKDPSMWNRICVECHVTGGQPRFDPSSGVPESRVAELGIACEACHGPAQAHVTANASPWRRTTLHQSAAGDPTIVNPARLPAARASEVCGQCHGIGCPPDGWMQDGLRYRPGQRLRDSKPILELATLDKSACRRQIAADASFAPSRYWSDGMVRVSGREYNGLIESPCFQRGTLGCLSCHSMHQSDPNWQLAQERDGNAACTQCHRAIGEKLAAHTHHRAGSTGSTCYNCHMPHTTYGLLRAMRSHQISVPRVQASLDTGRPNACNLCHLDRTLAWTSAALQRWYGTTPPRLSDEQRTVAASVLEVARGEAGVRVLIAWSMGWPAARAASSSAWMAPYLIELLDDEYAAIRYVAARSLRALPGFEDFRYDYVAPEPARWAAQKDARQRLSRVAQTTGGAELLYDAGGRFERGELERLMTERREDDEMFLAE
jgi:predicted CXXCH cytochrome family protein